MRAPLSCILAAFLLRQCSPANVTERQDADSVSTAEVRMWVPLYHSFYLLAPHHAGAHLSRPFSALGRKRKQCFLLIDSSLDDFDKVPCPPGAIYFSKLPPLFNGAGGSTGHAKGALVDAPTSAHTSLGERYGGRSGGGSGSTAAAAAVSVALPLFSRIVHSLSEKRSDSGHGGMHGGAGAVNGCCCRAVLAVRDPLDTLVERFFESTNFDQAEGKKAAPHEKKAGGGALGKEAAAAAAAPPTAPHNTSSASTKAAATSASSGGLDDFVLTNWKGAAEMEARTRVAKLALDALHCRVLISPYEEMVVRPDAWAASLADFLGIVRPGGPTPSVPVFSNSNSSSGSGGGGDKGKGKESGGKVDTCEGVVDACGGVGAQSSRKKSVSAVSSRAEQRQTMARQWRQLVDSAQEQTKANARAKDSADKAIEAIVAAAAASAAAAADTDTADDAKTSSPSSASVQKRGKQLRLAASSAALERERGLFFVGSAARMLNHKTLAKLAARRDDVTAYRSATASANHELNLRQQRSRVQSMHNATAAAVKAQRTAFTASAAAAAAAAAAAPVAVAAPANDDALSAALPRVYPAAPSSLYVVPSSSSSSYPVLAGDLLKSKLSSLSFSQSLSSPLSQSLSSSSLSSLAKPPASSSFSSLNSPSLSAPPALEPRLYPHDQIGHHQQHQKFKNRASWKAMWRATHGQQRRT